MPVGDVIKWVLGTRCLRQPRKEGIKCLERGVDKGIEQTNEGKPSEGAAQSCQVAGTPEGHCTTEARGQKSAGDMQKASYKNLSSPGAHTQPPPESPCPPEETNDTRHHPGRMDGWCLAGSEFAASLQDASPNLC